MQVALSRAADADIAEIARYTLERWGPIQADKYIGGLRNEIDDLVASAIDEVPGLVRPIRRITYRSHFIFFERLPDRVLVVRVLHRRMDILRHLS